MQPEATNLVSWSCFCQKTTFFILVLTQASNCGEAGQSASLEDFNIVVAVVLEMQFFPHCHGKPEAACVLHRLRGAK